MLSTAHTATRILVAADSPLEALALENTLRAAGRRDVRVTSDAREVAPLYDKWPYRLLVLDMGLRSLDGFAVLESLSAPIERRKLAVLALTGAGDKATRERALALGAADVFMRPFTRAETVMRVTGALASLPDPGASARATNPARRRFTPIF